MHGTVEMHVDTTHKRRYVSFLYMFYNAYEIYVFKYTDIHRKFEDVLIIELNIAFPIERVSILKNFLSTNLYSH